jgi:hypothetical protein
MSSTKFKRGERKGNKNVRAAYHSKASIWEMIMGKNSGLFRGQHLGRWKGSTSTSVFGGLRGI